MPDLSRSQVVVYGAIAVALLFVGARAIRAEGSGGPVVLVLDSGELIFIGENRRRKAASASAAAAGPTWSSTSPARSAGPASTGCRPGRGSPTRSSGPAAPTAEAQLEAVNLAARLADGQQVVVPEEGPGGAPVGAAGADAEEGPISLGTATVEQLDTIDGIGPVTAQKIVEYRDQHGGLSSVDQLDQVSGIGPATMESLRARLQP